MSARTHYFRLGLFVISAVTLAIVSVMIFGAGRLFRDTIMMETYLDESVQGLYVGSAVKYRGVQIGSVERITFVSELYALDSSSDDYLRYDRYVAVLVALNSKVVGDMTSEAAISILEKMIADGFRVRLAAQGVTGVAYLEADYLDPQRNPPLPIAWEPQSYYVPSAPSTITRFTQSIDQTLQKLSQVDIERIMTNVDAVAQLLRQTVDDARVPVLSQQTAQFLEELGHTNRRIQVLLDRPENQQLLASAHQASVRMNTVLKRFNDLLKNPAIGRILENLVPASARLNVAAKALPDTLAVAKRAFRRVDHLVSGQQHDIEVAIQDLRLILSALTTVAENAKHYPSQLFFGSPPPRPELGTEP